VVVTLPEKVPEYETTVEEAGAVVVFESDKEGRMSRRCRVEEERQAPAERLKPDRHPARSVVSDGLGGA
jgi:hypothetical protein